MKLDQSDWLFTAFLKAGTSPGFIFPVTSHVVQRAFGMLSGPPKDILDHGIHAPTILLTPGFTHTARDMCEIAQVLAEKSNIAFVSTLPWFTSGLVDLSECVLERLKEVMKTQKGPIILSEKSIFRNVSLEYERF